MVYLTLMKNTPLKLLMILHNKNSQKVPAALLGKVPCKVGFQSIQSFKTKCSSLFLALLVKPAELLLSLCVHLSVRLSVCPSHTLLKSSDWIITKLHQWNQDMNCSRRFFHFLTTCRSSKMVATAAILIFV